LQLGNAYTELDRLETAEALFRRALAQDDTSAHTRRRLADVLAAQNAIADAVNEYLAIVHAYKASVAAHKEALGAAALEEQRQQAAARATGSHSDELLLHHSDSEAQQVDLAVPLPSDETTAGNKASQHHPGPAPRDRAECVAALTECTRLLRSLGRDNEIAPLRAFRAELQQEATENSQ
jgi:tetratricopeptide (TPR) repeat protein